jgi:HAD superfamily hydrolase (TIGR01662 family)
MGSEGAARWIVGEPWARVATFDLDKTLLGYRTEDVPASVLAALRDLVASGRKIVLVSNAHGVRVNRVRRVAATIGEYTGAPCGVVVPADAGDKIKPDPGMFRVAAERAGVEPTACVHVGDQLFKDIWGAERAGFGATVLVRPTGDGDHLGVRYLQRPLETLARPWLGYPLVTRRFPVKARLVRG